MLRNLNSTTPTTGWTNITGTYDPYSNDLYTPNDALDTFRIENINGVVTGTVTGRVFVSTPVIRNIPFQEQRYLDRHNSAWAENLKQKQAIEQLKREYEDYLLKDTSFFPKDMIQKASEILEKHMPAPPSPPPLKIVSPQLELF